MNLLDGKSYHLRTRSQRPASRRPALELLESRHLLSVSLPGIDAIQPADGTVLLQAPQQLAITFDPGDVTTIDNVFSGLLGTEPGQTFPALVAFDNVSQGDNAEVELDQVGPGGVGSPVLGSNTSSPLQENVTIQTAADGTVSQAQVSISPSAGNLGLGPGTYQLDILPGTVLASVFGSFYPASAWAGSQPVPIAQFTILGPGVTLGGAIKLGNIGPTTRSVSGFVDPQNASSSVSLYQFTLPSGNRWQLNAQLLSQAIGSPLTAGLTLFDAKGDVLAENTSGAGSATNRSDPFLIEGLAPGTYYVGVSAAKNLTGWLNGYNPVTGTPGIAGFEGPSGRFLLQLFADPAVSTTTLVGHTLEYADSLEPSPTGLDLTFSGPVNATPLFLPDQQETALEVVNASGQVWPITAVSDQFATNALGFIFDEPLPAGTYRLVDPVQGGLTDSSGLPLVAPSGNPSGVLATWTIAPTGASAPTIWASSGPARST